MLTESEKQWLHERKLSPNPYCGWCMRYALCCVPHYNKCPIKNADLGDALEFSERVAVKLAITGDIWDFEDMPCRGDERQYIRINCKLRKNHWDCADCFLKAARLKVEEEMDGECQN